MVSILAFHSHNLSSSPSFDKKMGEGFKHNLAVFEAVSQKL